MMHMKKIIPFLLVAVITLSGCQNNPKSEDIVGVWEVYDCENKECIGARLYFYEDGRGLARDAFGWSAMPNVYKIDHGKLYISDERDKDFQSPRDITRIVIKNNSFVFESIPSNGIFSSCGVMKFKRVSSS